MSEPSDPEEPSPVPDWDDEYVETVGERLAHSYDLERDYEVRGERFDLYGQMKIRGGKHFFHPALSYAHHESYEHLFLRRTEGVTAEELDGLVKLGHELADDEGWIDPDEEHYSTDFTFVLVAPEVPKKVRPRVSGLDERTLIKYGYHGSYEVNLAVVAPEKKDLVANDSAEVEGAVRVWEPVESEEPGLLGSLVRWLPI